MIITFLHHQCFKKSVNYILSEDNVISVSHGTKVIKLSDNKIIQLPKLQCKRTCIDIIKAYFNITKNDANHASQKSMYNILNLISLIKCWMQGMWHLGV